jgi:hypothetical protein
MKKFPKIFIRISLILVTSLFLLNCSNESQDDDDNVIMDTFDSQSDNLKTVPLENSLNFLKKLNSDRLTNRGLISDDIGLKIDIESLEQIDIANTDAKLNIASATTKFEGVETEFLQIEIDGELQTILFHHIPEKNITMTSRRPIDDENFTGDVYSTDLDGRVLSGFRINKGTISGSYNPSPYAIDPDPIKLNEVIIKNTYVAPVANNNIGTMMDYQFVRSQNNGSSMGLAYAAYYKHLMFQNLEKTIVDKDLNPCLKEVLEKLKNAKQSDIAKILETLGVNNGPKVTLQMGPTEPGNYAQATKISKYDYAITVSPDYTGATKLFRAFALLHEITHAYFFSLVDNYNTYPTNLPFDGLPILYQAYGGKGYPGGTTAAQHEAMAAIKYVDIIASALQEYDGNFTTSYEVYKDLAWSGLMKTAAFKKEFPEGSAGRTRIENRFSCEQRGGTIGSQSPVGKPCK